MEKLYLDPDATNYSYTRGDEFVSASVDGSPSRSRVDFIGASATLSIAWVLGPDEFAYINAFYRTSIKRGTMPFRLDLILDHAELDEYQCQFVPGTFGMTSQQGQAYVVEAQIEVTPKAPDEAGDLAIIESFDAYGI